MATNRSDTRVLPLLQAMLVQDATGVSDGLLLRWYLAEGDEAAFAVLVRRHGPMVLGVCRRVLGNVADADDAFQAVFMVLLRKAPALASLPVVGDWLHGVARLTALKAKAAAARRRTVERATARPEAKGEEARNDWLPRLDEELGRLPQKYRLPIVLCDLESKTRQEAALQLGWPEGTVAGRLARGRALLAKRLLRGAVVMVGVVPGALTENAVKASVPLRWVQCIIQAAASSSAPKTIVHGVLAAEAVTLANGVLRTMLWNKAIVVALAIVTGVVLAGVGGRPVQVLAKLW